jgi:hypothetical protein
MAEATPAKYSLTTLPAKYLVGAACS